MLATQWRRDGEQRKAPTYFKAGERLLVRGKLRGTLWACRDLYTDPWGGSTKKRSQKSDLLRGTRWPIQSSWTDV